MNDNLEKIGQTVDDLESLIAGLAIPMPPQFHLDQLKNILPEKIKAIKEAVIAESGENPWE
tara:strand:+ start:1512 stop:1694 length:183 start_codon:yes stop_codon:yes gene_type:complete